MTIKKGSMHHLHSERSKSRRERGLSVPTPPTVPPAGGMMYPGMPVGAVIAFAGELSQSLSESGDFKTNLFMFNWLLCDGTKVDVAKYPELFSALGYRYGGSGAQFGLPDYQGTFLRGVDDSGKHSGSREDRSAPSSGSQNSVGSTQDYAIKTHEHYYKYHMTGAITPADPPSATFLSTTTIDKETTDLLQAKTSDTESRPVNTFVYWLIKASMD